MLIKLAKTDVLLIDLFYEQSCCANELDTFSCW
jgi:hypothetical protein